LELEHQQATGDPGWAVPALHRDLPVGYLMLMGQ